MKIQDRPYPNSRVLHNVTVPVTQQGTRILVLETARLVAGNTLQVYLQVAGVDTGIPSECSNTVIEGLYHVIVIGAALGLAPITNNRLDKQVSAGAVAFGADVTFAVAPSVNPNGTIADLSLLANTPTPRTGNLAIFWMVNRGDFA